MERSIIIADMSESDNVIESSTTCRIERELIDGIRKKNSALMAMPLNTRSLNIPLNVKIIS